MSGGERTRAASMRQEVAPVVPSTCFPTTGGGHDPNIIIAPRRCWWRCFCYTNDTKVQQLHILVAPRPQWALSCLQVDITAWTRQDITTPDLAGAVRLAVNRGVKLGTINRVLGDVGLRWDTPAGDLRSSVHGELGRRR
jgi:hypothetical protein